MKKRNWLIEIRKAKGLGLTEMARKLEVTVTYYNYIEQGKRRPSPQLAQKISEILGLDWTMFYPKESEE